MTDCASSLIVACTIPAISAGSVLWEKILETVTPVVTSSKMDEVGKIMWNVIVPIAGIVIGVVLLVDHLRRPIGPTNTDAPVQHEASVVALGKAYKTALVKAGADMIDAMKTGNYKNLDEFTQAQNKALDDSLKLAYTPIAREMETRFGKAEDKDNTANMAAVKSFSVDLEKGFSGK